MGDLYQRPRNSGEKITENYVVIIWQASKGTNVFGYVVLGGIFLTFFLKPVWKIRQIS